MREFVVSESSLYARARCKRELVVCESSLYARVCCKRELVVQTPEFCDFGPALLLCKHEGHGQILSERIISNPQLVISCIFLHDI